MSSISQIISHLLDKGLVETTSLFNDPQFNQFVCFSTICGIFLQSWFYPSAIINKNRYKLNKVHIDDYLDFLNKLKKQPYYREHLESKIFLSKTLQFYKKNLRQNDLEFYKQKYNFFSYNLCSI